MLKVVMIGFTKIFKMLIALVKGKSLLQNLRPLKIAFLNSSILTLTIRLILLNIPLEYKAKPQQQLMHSTKQQALKFLTTLKDKVSITKTNCRK